MSRPRMHSDGIVRKLVCILGRRYAAVFFEKLGKVSLIRNSDQLRDLRYTALACSKQFFGMIDL